MTIAIMMITIAITATTTPNAISPVVLSLRWFVSATDIRLQQYFIGCIKLPQEVAALRVKNFFTVQIRWIHKLPM